MTFRSKKIDFVVLVAFIGIAYLYSSLTPDLYIGKSLIAGAVFILPGIIYLGWRTPKPWKKIALATLIFGGLFGFFFEFVQEFNHSYTVTSRIFPKILGIVPLDNVLGHMMMACLTFTFYEHFIQTDRYTAISNRYKRALWVAVSCIIATLTLFYIQPEWIVVEYSYAFLGALAIVPPLLLAYQEPRYGGEMAKMVPFFFLLYIVVEYVAVAYGWWIYPSSHYIGQVSIMAITFPFEELFFWMLCYAAALISYYKLFIDRPTKVKS